MVFVLELCAIVQVIKEDGDRERGDMVSASAQGSGLNEREIAMMERIFREELQKRTLLREYYPNMDPIDWVIEYL